MTLLRDFFSQTHKQLCCFTLWVYMPTHLPFLLTLNKFPKEIAGNDITNCLTHTMYAIAFKAAWELFRHWRIKLCQDISCLFEDYLVIICLRHYFYSRGACLRWNLPSHSWSRSLSSQGIIYGPSLDLAPDTTHEGLGRNLARKCPDGMLQFLNSANSSFRTSMWLVRYYSTFQNFYVCFLSLLERECWLAEVMFFPSSTPTAAFQRSRHFWARFFPRPFLAGWVWGPD